MGGWEPQWVVRKLKFTHLFGLRSYAYVIVISIVPAVVKKINHQKHRH